MIEENFNGATYRLVTENDMQPVWWLEHYGHNDFRLFDMPPTKPQGFSYDFKSLCDALIYAKNNNIKVEVI